MFLSYLGAKLQLAECTILSVVMNIKKMGLKIALFTILMLIYIKLTNSQK